MKQITGGEFIGLIQQNPSWCKNLKEQLEITTFADFRNSQITHLSPLLTFSHKEWAGDFSNCKDLKVATGTFHGPVDFSRSSIEKIENLTVTGTNKYRASTSFFGCQNLKVATGNYKGSADFRNSGVTSIKNLIIKNSTINGEKAWLTRCPIQYVPKEYRTEKFHFDEGVKEKSTLKDRTINKIKEETNNIEL